MFRKIHSKNQPDSDLNPLAELRKEFSVYIDKLDQHISSFCLKYPKQVYTGMVLGLLFSITISFWPSGPITRHVKAEQTSSTKTARAKSKPIRNNFDQILQKGAVLKESLTLKTQVETLIAKDSLTASDSIVLNKCINRLQQLSNATH